MVKKPDFYEPDRIGTLFYPDINRIASEAFDCGLSPSAGDKRVVLLLIIDMQIDFCHKQGSLYVPGAEDDIRRLIEFLYANAEIITKIFCSLDTHLPYQIFHPSWWSNEHGNHPPPFTIVMDSDITNSKWQPLIAPEWSASYTEKLNRQAKKELVIWPYHVLTGGIGNSLDPELWSAVFWHSIARNSQPTFLRKGKLPLTEHYSIFRPEILPPDHAGFSKKHSVLDSIEQGDTIIIAGEAESHCVLESIEDIVEEYEDRPELLSQIYVLKDCMSPVEHPDVDFHSLAIEQFNKFAEKGVKFIVSTDPLPF
jgi:nicotinamidase-related amidase